MRGRTQARPALEALEDRTVPSTATHFAVNAPTSATAGTPFSLTLSALDASGLVVTGYTGTVHFTASAGSHVLPVDYTFTAADGGVHTFSGVTLGIAGTEKVTAADVASPSVAGTASVRVAAGAATHFAVGVPAAETTGTPFAVTLTALDQYGNQASGYRGTAHFTSTDLSAVLPGNYNFASSDGGKHSFSGVTLNTAGTDTLTAADTATPSIAGSAPVSVSMAVTQFAVQGPDTVTAGDPFSITVIAEDANGHIVPGYTGTVNLSCPGLTAFGLTAFGLPSSYAFTPADGGSHTFSGITLTSTDGAVIDVGDAQVPSANGSANITVNPGPVTQFAVGTPIGFMEEQAGSLFTLPVTAEDAYGNIATNYTGTVHFTSGGTSDTLPADYTFTAADGGIQTFYCTLDTAGIQVITVTDTATFATGGDAIIIDPGPASSFILEAPSSTTAGSSFSVTVTALDAYGNQATGYGGTVYLSSSDPLAVLPADYSGDGGTYFFDGLVLSSPGYQTITASDSEAPVSGSVSVNVTPAVGAATHFAVTAPAGAQAGAPFSVTVTALDQNGNVVPGYTGTAHFTASAGSYVLPADYTFTAADAGSHTFTGVSLGIAGPEMLTVADTATPSISGLAGVQVAPGPATDFSFSGPVGVVTAGVPFTTSLTALDQYGNLATGYRGTVHFSSTDPAAVLPGDYSFSAADGGKHTFSGLSFASVGNDSITAADTLTPSVAGTAVVNVRSAVTHFAIAAPGVVGAGVPFSMTLTAWDANNHPVPNYTGTVHFTSSAPQSVLPADYTFTAADGGTHTFPNGFTLDTAGADAVGVADTANPSIRSAGSFTVKPAPMASLGLTAPATAIAGMGFTVTLTAHDAYGNVATGYAGTVHFTASGGSNTLPANYTFTAADAGIHTFTGVALGTAGSQTLTVADTSTSSASGTASIDVSPLMPGVATHFAVTAPAGATAGAAFSVTVTALDQSGNVCPGYRGTVHFTVSAGAHVVPADYTFTAADGGAHTFSGITLGIAGTETLTVTDTATATVTGKASVRVTPGPGSNVVVTAPSGVTAGVPFSITLTVYDQFGNLASGYGGTVHFASSDGAAVLPANYTFVPGDGGKHTFTGVVLKTAGSQTLTVSDALTTAVLAHATVAVSGAAPASAANVQPAPSDLVAGPPTTTLDEFYAQVAASQAGTKAHPAARKGGKKHHRHHHA